MAPTPLDLPSVTKLYGVSKDDLLAYEAEGLVSPFRVGEDRYYTPKDLLRIEVVLKGRNLGFSLRAIKQIIEAHAPALPAPTIDKERVRMQIAQLEGEKDALQATIDRLQAKLEDLE